MAKDVIRPTDAEGRALGLRLLRTARSGALASLAPTGGPLSSLVSVATDGDGTPLILVSSLSAHTGQLIADPRSSLLLSAPGRGDPLAHPRISLLTRARRLIREGVDGARARRRFLARHPKAELYVDFSDFSFFALDVERASLNGGFARAYELVREDLVLDMTGAGEIAAIEEGAIAHLNDDHSDALALYAAALGAEADAGPPWRCTGLDPDGLDLARGDAALRVPFPERVTTGAALRATLASMARDARGRAAPG